LLRTALITGLVCGAGCSHPVAIRTNVRGATVKVDGANLGPAPATFTDTHGVQRNYLVRVEAPGYETTTRNLVHEWDPGCIAGWALGGLLCLPVWFGMIGCSKLPRDVYEIELVPLERPPDSEDAAAWVERG
jgi:hypothetical protein